MCDSTVNTRPEDAAKIAENIRQSLLTLNEIKHLKWFFSNPSIISDNQVQDILFYTTQIRSMADKLQTVHKDIIVMSTSSDSSDSDMSS